MRLDEPGLGIEFPSEHNEESDKGTDERPKATATNCNNENIPNRVNLCHMELWLIIFGGMATFLGLVAATTGLHFHQRNLTIWIACAASIFGVLAVFCAIQNMFTKAEEAEAMASKEKTGGPPALKGADVHLVDHTLVLSLKDDEPSRVEFSLVNYGDMEATVTVGDLTFVITTDINQKVFQYQKGVSETITLPPNPNLKFEGQLRFDLKMTQAKLDAINKGEARLFVAARSKCIDKSGRESRLVFSGMYDSLFARHIKSLPAGVIFE